MKRRVVVSQTFYNVTALMTLTDTFDSENSENEVFHRITIKNVKPAMCSEVKGYPASLSLSGDIIEMVSNSGNISTDNFYQII